MSYVPIYSANLDCYQSPKCRKLAHLFLDDKV